MLGAKSEPQVLEVLTVLQLHALEVTSIYTLARLRGFKSLLHPLFLCTPGRVKELLQGSVTLTVQWEYHYMGHKLVCREKYI